LDPEIALKWTIIGLFDPLRKQHRSLLLEDVRRRKTDHALGNYEIHIVSEFQLRMPSRSSTKWQKLKSVCYITIDEACPGLEQTSVQLTPVIQHPYNDILTQKFEGVESTWVCMCIKFQHRADLP
jgi:hypothetical protein